MTTREILLRARDLIETRGLAKGTTVDADGGVCSLSAMDIAVRGTRHMFAEDDTEYWGARMALAAVVGRGIIAWNDSPRTSKADAIAAFEAAAEGVAT